MKSFSKIKTGFTDYKYFRMAMHIYIYIYTKSIRVNLSPSRTDLLLDFNNSSVRLFTDKKQEHIPAELLHCMLWQKGGEDYRTPFLSLFNKTMLRTLSKSLFDGCATLLGTCIKAFHSFLNSLRWLRITKTSSPLSHSLLCISGCLFHIFPPLPISSLS